ncbi:glycosyltransferase family 4 protein [Halalkalibacter alkalisediminis]|uniref:Glycosyltransferase family 4 protein n=1 Tax=Halalkalibacter alkalisediminis TaxID=935616 RepID=A0ABV6NFB1_9BACI|nr:glycosyltransferase family 4 protein [Halalkalibacter alkalisediminis]
MKILVIWRLLTVGGVNAGWRNRAIYFKKQGITTDFLYTKDLGGMHMMEDVAQVFLTKDKDKIHQIIQENQYDAIIVVDTSQAYTWLKETNYKGPIIIEARTPEITKLKQNLQGKEKVNPEKFIVPSDYQKRVLSILLDQSKPIEVIHNSTDTLFFRPLDLEEVNRSNEPKVPEGKKIVAYIGRLDHRKNWRLFLKIAEMVSKERRDIEFWVIGGDRSVDKDLFEEEWKKKQLTDVVKWFPVIPYHQMPTIYAKIKHSGGCTIATTRAESFGNTFIESMACGVPVIAPDISSIPEIVVNGETGYLYRENYIRGAAEHIYRIVDQPHKYEKLSNSARERVEKWFSLSQCANKYIETLKDVTKGEGE